jgi:hypothetical protein
MTILILGGADDDHARHMRDYLHQHGADVELLDSRWFPASLRIGFDPVSGQGTLLFPTGRRLAWEEVQAVYWRSYDGIATPPIGDAEQAYIAANDARGLFESFLIRLPARWVNPWHAYQLHQTKPAQLAIVAAVGIPVPATLLSNDPEAVRTFVGQRPCSIFKPVQGGAHARRVTSAHLTDANLRSLAIAPVTLQEEVPGANVRAFVAGERVLACELKTQELDYRDDPQAGIVPHRLPAEVEAHCLAAARALELLWTGIDLRRTPEGRYVFLEANPSPMFLGFQQRSGLPLTEALAGLLLS